jgi:hypothetical protein
MIHPQKGNIHLGIALLVALVALISCAPLKINPAATGSIAGTVTDIEGDPVVGARVWVDGVGETLTNTNGTYLLTDVPEGFKNVRAATRIGNQDWTGIALAQVFADDITRNANILLCPTNLQGSIEGLRAGPDRTPHRRTQGCSLAGP